MDAPDFFALHTTYPRRLLLYPKYIATIDPSTYFERNRNALSPGPQHCKTCTQHHKMYFLATKQTERNQNVGKKECRDQGTIRSSLLRILM